jgi:phage-related protein (TIGR01555 family)
MARRKKTNDKQLQNSLISLNQMLSYQNTPQINKTDTLIQNVDNELITLNRSVLTYAYTKIGIVKTFVQQPVLDGFRGDIEINSNQLDNDEIAELKAFMKEKNVKKVISDAFIWSRLFGGAGIIINVGEKYDKPLNIDNIKQDSPLEFYDSDRWEFSSTTTIATADKTKQELTEDFYLYYGEKIHKSRIIRINGIMPPSFVRQQLQGWGLSVIEDILRSLNSYFKNQNLIFELLDEAKIDIYKIQGFNNALGDAETTNAIATRIQEGNKLKNYLNAITMDTEDEYEQKQLTFAGLSDMLTQCRIGIASDLRIPMTKLFGLSASGFNSGEDDIENYNSMIESTVRSQALPVWEQITKICCQVKFGFVPDDLGIEFESLRIMSSEQEEGIKTNQFNRYIALYDRGLIDESELIEILNNEGLSNVDPE